MAIKIERTCSYCERPIFGRIDKKFCNDTCRNAFHNQLDPELSDYIRGVNRLLKKNRKILGRELGNQDFAKVRRDDLLIQGFQFDYHTSIFVNKEGKTYYYCYDLGYIADKQAAITIVRKPEWLG